MTAQTFRRHLSVALAAIAVTMTVVACSTGAGSPTSAPETPAPSGTPLPSAQPSPVATPAPTVAPTEDPGTDSMPITVDLATADGHRVRVDVVDPAGLLTGARSGSPAEGISVDTGVVKVESVDDRTLRLTWSDFAMDNALALYLDESGRTAILVQPGPIGAVDAIGADRQLVLTFRAPIAASDLAVSVQDGIDTPGE